MSYVYFFEIKAFLNISGRVNDILIDMNVELSLVICSMLDNLRTINLDYSYLRDPEWIVISLKSWLKECYINQEHELKGANVIYGDQSLI